MCENIKSPQCGSKSQKCSQDDYFTGTISTKKSIGWRLPSWTGPGCPSCDPNIFTLKNAGLSSFDDACQTDFVFNKTVLKSPCAYVKCISHGKICISPSNCVPISAWGLNDGCKPQEPILSENDKALCCVGNKTGKKCPTGYCINNDT